MATQDDFLRQLQAEYSGYGMGSEADKASHLSTLGGASTYLTSLANTNIGQFGDDQKRQALQKAEIARQLAAGVQNPQMSQDWQDAEARRNPTQYAQQDLVAMRQGMDAAGGMGNFFGTTADSTQEQLNLRNQLLGAVEDPFAGQNLEDGAVRAQVQEYQKRNPNYIPVNTYRGAAPGLADSINQDTGRAYQENGTNENPWIGNKGFLQTNLLTAPQKQMYDNYNAPQVAQQQSPQQRPAAYSSAQSTTGYSAPNMQQPQPQQTSYGFKPAGASQPRPAAKPAGYNAPSLGYARQRQRGMGYE